MLRKKVVIVLVLLSLLVVGAAPLAVQAQDDPPVYRQRVSIYPYRSGWTYEVEQGTEVVFTFGWIACVPDVDFRTLRRDYRLNWRERLATLFAYGFGSYPDTADPLEAFRHLTALYPFYFKNEDTGYVIVHRLDFGDTRERYLPDVVPVTYDYCLDPTWDAYKLVWEYEMELEPGTYTLEADIYVLSFLTDFADSDMDGRPDVYDAFYWYEWYPDYAPFTATIIVK